MQLPKISIITVVYNDAEHIVETMDSIINQSYENIEYILIDGGSSDGTKEIIESRLKELGEEIQQGEIQEHTPNANNALDNASNTAPTLNNALDNTSNTLRPEHINPQSFYLQTKHKTKPNFSFKFLSEKDSGIYDAMNKGILLTTGEWCNFMNCGDRFYSLDTLKEFFEKFFKMHGGGDRERFAILYGDTHIIYDKAHSKVLYASTKPHKYHHNFIHQSALISTPLMKDYKYNTSFKIAGDTHFFTKAYNEGKGFCYIPLVVSSFNVCGISSNLSWQMFKEDCQIGFAYNRLFPLFYTFQYIFWIIPRVCIRNAIPARFRNKARILLGKKSH